MEKEQKIQLRNKYKNAPDQELIDMVSEGEEGFVEGAYALLVEEIKQRGLEGKLREIEENKRKKIELEKARLRDIKKEGYVCIFRTPYQSEIVLIKSLLDANEIPYSIDNEHFASLRGAADGVINFGVMVAESFCEKAKNLLEEFISPKKKKSGYSEPSEAKKEDTVTLRHASNKFLIVGFIILGSFCLIGGSFYAIRILFMYASSHKDLVIFVSGYISFLVSLAIAFFGGLMIFYTIKKLKIAGKAGRHN